MFWFIVLYVSAQISTSKVITSDDQAIDHILHSIEPQMESLTNEMNSQMESALHSSSESHSKRSFQIKGFFNKYLKESFADPTLNKFRPLLKQRLQEGFDTFASKKARMNPADQRKVHQLARKEALKISSDAKNLLKAHLDSSLNEWVHQHSRSPSKSSRSLSKRQQESTQDVDQISKWDKLKDMFHNGIFGKYDTTGMYVNMALNILITMGAFFASSTMTWKMAVIIMVFQMLIIQPIITRLLNGYWLYLDDEDVMPMAQ